MKVKAWIVWGKNGTYNYWSIEKIFIDDIITSGHTRAQRYLKEQQSDDEMKFIKWKGKISKCNILLGKTDTKFQKIVNKKEKGLL